MIELISTSPQQTEQIAIDFAANLLPGTVLSLIGNLGAGKTCFVRGIARGLGVPSSAHVRSPTFTLMNEYRGGRLDIFHFDFYRLSNGQDLFDLGLEEYFFGEGVTIAEWADKFPDAMPTQSQDISFEIIDDVTRKIIFG